MAGRGALLAGPHQDPRRSADSRARSFPDLNLRTYVRDERTGTPGVYFFSLDASNLLAVAAARAFFHLPYHWAEMQLEQRSEREFAFYSRRRFSPEPVIFKARYRGWAHAEAGRRRSGTLEYFLTERYCLFTNNRADSRSAPICTMFPGRWKRPRRRSSRTIWRHRSASSCPTRSRCCTIRGGWRSTSGQRSWCAPRWHPGRLP